MNDCHLNNNQTNKQTNGNPMPSFLAFLLAYCCLLVIRTSPFQGFFTNVFNLFLFRSFSCLTAAAVGLFSAVLWYGLFSLYLSYSWNHLHYKLLRHIRISVKFMRSIPDWLQCQNCSASLFNFALLDFILFFKYNLLSSFAFFSTSNASYFNLHLCSILAFKSVF